MATFSVNQATHLYVVKSLKATGVTAADPVGTISFHNTYEGDEFYFKYRGAGGVLRSDLVKKKNTLWVTAKKAAELAIHYKQYSITFDSDKIEEAKKTLNYNKKDTPLYLKFTFKQYYSPGEDEIHTEYVSLSDYTNLKAVAKDVYKAFHRNGIDPAIDVIITGGTPATLEDIEAAETVTSIKVRAAETPWRRGVKYDEPANYYVQALLAIDHNVSTITNTPDPNDALSLNPEGTSTFIDGGVTIKKEADYLGVNGKKMADLEWFYMGERGDQYRGINWPDNVETTYVLEDVSKGYGCIDVHYAYSGANESVQLSEKDFMLVGEDTAIAAVVTALNKQLPTDVQAKLSK